MRFSIFYLLLVGLFFFLFVNPKSIRKIFKKIKVLLKF